MPLIVNCDALLNVFTVAETGRYLPGMSGRAKRVLLYTATLLIAPMPVMPFAKGTREYALAVMACGAILALSSFYVTRGEMRVKHRNLVGNKLLAASFITLLFGLLIFVGSILYLTKILKF